MDSDEMDENLVEVPGDIDPPSGPPIPPAADLDLPKICLYDDITADNLAELDTEAICIAWLAKYEKGERDKHVLASLEIFREYWLKVVPHVYELRVDHNCLEPLSESDFVEKYLIEPLCYFLTGGPCNEDMLKNYLSACDQPATVCGRVFQVGEATYSCRECGIDPTCVLCAECFKASAHKNHKYKIATSAGGGYCDCGDHEAWKNYVHCEVHLPKTQEIPQDKKIDYEGFEKRAYFLFPTVLAYCFQMTTSEYDRRMPENFETYEKEMEKANISSLYCTVLYNDETHTFDLVIQTLSRALGCSKKHAIEFATTIDREGRSIVKVGGFSPCHNVLKIIERQTTGRGPNTKALKSSVMKAEVVQHQAFALRLLSWLESLCSQSKTIRLIIQNIIYCRDYIMPTIRNWYVENKTLRLWLIEGVLLHDTKLWKAARSCWHRLIIAGLLKEYDSKKMFSELFTRQYTSTMDDFIRDDHDHSYSVTSLSVQIFTVPSIAHYLVETHDVLYTILRVLLAQCTERLNSRGKLEFDRGAVVTSFKRTNFAILDLKYILTNPPTEWTGLMVKNFTHAVDSFLRFLTYMQEMDAVTRQVGQHMEYEPEWESAFNLHIKLQPVVQLALEWCGLNKPVFIRAFRHNLQDLTKAYEDLKSKTITLELANHSATCFIYDVASQPVSVHLPLTRFFAGLYTYLEKFELNFFSNEFNLISGDKPTPELIMEPALRTQVLIAQVNAGMWKRNGYSLLNQLYFYHNVRCRADMLDKDIITLQIAASVIESNEFLVHVIYRFGLIQWAQANFDEKALKPEGQEEDLGKYLNMLADEFLGLLITIVSARYLPGIGQVTKADTIRKEVIQQLCIEPMTHSTLNKALVENVNLETGLELVIRDVANQKDPTPQRTSVVYELKPEYFVDYDVYHYHYTREEMSKAEEKQRERKRSAREREIFPPPQLPPFTNMFNMVVNILQCDVFLHIISVVLYRSLQKTGRNNCESLVRKALHLIGHGLNEEISRNSKEMGHFFQFTEKARHWQIFELLDKMLQEPTASQYHGMILWLRGQFNIIKPEVIDVPLVAQPNEEAEKKRKAALVREAKEKMMAKMAAAQQKFMAVNKELFTEEGSDSADPESSTTGSKLTPSNTVAVGLHQTPCPIPDERFVCILCQEDQPLLIGAKRFVLAAFVQKSTVLAQYREKLIEESTPEYKLYMLRNITETNIAHPLFLKPNLNTAPVMSTCGHIMHESCWASHIETVQSKERRRPYRLRHPLSFDVDKNEWLCPMCDSICNATLPMAAPLLKMYSAPTWNFSPESTEALESSVMVAQTNSESFELWIQGMQILLKNKVATSKKMEVSQEFTSWITAKVGDRPEDNIIYYMKSVDLPALVAEMEPEDGKHFGRLYPIRPTVKSDPTYKWLNAGFHAKLTSFMSLNYVTATGAEINEQDFRNHPMLWNCLSFTIISSEAYHRDQQIPFFGSEVPLRKAIGIKYLTRACGVASDKPEMWTEYLQTFAIRLLTTILQNPGNTLSLYECDAFGLLISLTFSMPALFVHNETNVAFQSHLGNFTSTVSCLPPTGGLVDHHILRLCFMYHITQVLLSNDFSHCRCETEDVIPTETGPEDMDTHEALEPSKSTTFQSRKSYIFREAWRVINERGRGRYVGEYNKPWKNIHQYDCEEIWETIKKAAIPFLRCCAKFYENLTGITPPSCLEKTENTFDDLVRYLDLPSTFEDIFDTPFTWQMPYKWASHPHTPKILSAKTPGSDRFMANDDSFERLCSFIPHTATFEYPRKLGSLTPLPDDYTELINMVSNFTCKNSNTLDSRTPTICLICGTILCSQSYCCQREAKPNVVLGACMFHANFCGGGSGIFLRIRECKLFLTHGQNRGCFMSPPYLDEYGETDQGLRRGNPLTLSREKYEVFRKIWLQHSIPEEIARVTEHNPSVVPTEWQYL